MNNSLHRAALLLAAAIFTLPAPAENATVPARVEDTTKGRDYVRYTGDNKRGKLETVVVTMKKGGVNVELIGAVHIADTAYYQALTKLFTGYEDLLFELVDGQRMKEEMEGKRPVRRKGKAALVEPGEKAAPKDDEDRSPAFKIISGLMHGFGNYFHLQYQTDGIDYHTKNFVHADVSMDEFVRLQAEKGESFISLIEKAITAQLEIGSHPEAEPKGSQLLLALLGDSSGLKVAMARQLAMADDLVKAMEEGDGSVIISERNKKALAVFDREVAAGRKNLGIFYGAAHLFDMEKRLEQKGYQRTGERWMTAWDIKPRVDEKPAE